MVAASGKLREVALSKEDIPSPVFSSVAHALWSWHWPGPCQEGEARDSSALTGPRSPGPGPAGWHLAWQNPDPVTGMADNPNWPLSRLRFGVGFGSWFPIKGSAFQKESRRGAGTLS